MLVMKDRSNKSSGAHQLDRRDFLKTGLTGGIFAVTFPSLASAKGSDPLSPPSSEIQPFELDEITVTELQAGMGAGKYTARSLAEKYIARIKSIDREGPELRTVIELNPEALAIADALDKERKEKGARGPLHGIPVLIKDNIDTTDRIETAR
jgi:amidase